MAASPRSQIKRVSANELCLHILPAATRRAFLKFTALPLLRRLPWYLAGGTALAMQAGHRQSVDLDFFVNLPAFKENAVAAELLKTGEWNTSFQDRGTLYGVFLGAKTSFIAYPFFIPSQSRLQCGTVQILLPEDIAVMKIIAISQRGRKRDFLDLYWYCLNREPLAFPVRRALKQFLGQERNLNHILRSLTYFEDAENDPMPKIFFKADWTGIKRFFRREAPRIMREKIGL